VIYWKHFENVSFDLHSDCYCHAPLNRFSVCLQLSEVSVLNSKSKKCRRRFKRKKTNFGMFLSSFETISESTETVVNNSAFLFMLMIWMPPEFRHGWPWIVLLYTWSLINFPGRPFGHLHLPQIFDSVCHKMDFVAAHDCLVTTGWCIVNSSAEEQRVAGSTSAAGAAGAGSHESVNTLVSPSASASVFITLVNLSSSTPFIRRYRLASFPFSVFKCPSKSAYKLKCSLIFNNCI